MQRLTLLAFTAVVLLACNDTSSPTTADPAPNFGKSEPGIIITSLGPAKEFSQAEDVNDAGLVVGYTETWYTSPLRAFLWTPSQPRATMGTLQDIGTLGGPTAAAKGINNSGSVVGFASDAAGAGHPFLWTQTGGMQDLDLDPLWTSAAPQDINDAGDVIGVAVTGAGNRGAVWHVGVNAGGVVQVIGRETLGILPGWKSSAAFAVNNLGQVAGWVSRAAGPNQAVLWTPTPTGWMTEDLGLLPNDYGSGAYGLNDQGQVVGWSRPQQGCVHAALWTTQGGRLSTRRALETSGGCSAEAWAINNEGQVAGRANSKSGTTATLWSLAPDGSTASIKNLGTLSGTAGSLAIGMSGNIGGITQVAGLSQPSSGGLRATLWTVR